MVNMNFQTTPESLSIREKLTKLMNTRAEMENELKEHLDILTSNNIGLTEPLVDSEGFPRQDIDVFQVRHARHRVIYLKNDLKNLMKEIETNLFLVHTIDGAAAESSGQASSQVPTNPIVRIGNVVANSPAEKSGLQKDDLVIEFGPVNSSNYRNLNDIAAIVKKSSNREIPLRIIRNGERQTILLKPQEFDGKGTVGCYFLNLETVER